MDKQRLRQQLHDVESHVRMKAAELERLTRRADATPTDRRHVTQLKQDLRHAESRMKALTNAISTLDRIGEQTTRHYLSRRKASPSQG
jgi:DNA repair exonuclease SbcCD ATPase subunit